MWVLVRHCSQGAGGDCWLCSQSAVRVLVTVLLACLRCCGGFWRCFLGAAVRQLVGAQVWGQGYSVALSAGQGAVCSPNS